MSAHSLPPIKQAFAPGDGETKESQSITDPILVASLARLEKESFLPDVESSAPSDRPKRRTVPADDEAAAATTLASNQEYRSKLDKYLGPLLNSIMSARPRDPYSFIAEYIRDACRGVGPPLVKPRPFAGSEFLHYKSSVLDPVMLPMMAELFSVKPAKPLQAIFLHAQKRLGISVKESGPQLVEIDLFDQMVQAIDTQQFDLLTKAVTTAKEGGLLAHDNAVLVRATKLQKKGERLVEKSKQRAVVALAAAVRRARTMLKGLDRLPSSKRVRRLAYLKATLTKAVSVAHKKKIADTEPTMKEALLQIINVDSRFRSEQKAVQNEHRASALDSLRQALDAVASGEPRGYSLVKFSLQRAKALRCSHLDPSMRRANELVATWEHLEAIENGQSFSVGMVTKIKTRLGKQMKHAKVRVEEIAAAQRLLDQKLEDSADEIYREMGYTDSDDDYDDDDDSGSGDGYDGSSGGGDGGNYGDGENTSRPPLVSSRRPSKGSVFTSKTSRSAWSNDSDENGDADDEDDEDSDQSDNESLPSREEDGGEGEEGSAEATADDGIGSRAKIV